MTSLLTCRLKEETLMNNDSIYHPPVRLVTCSVASVCLYVCPGRAHTFESLVDLQTSFLARDAFVRTNHRAVAVMFVRLSVWNGRTL